MNTVLVQKALVHPLTVALGRSFDKPGYPDLQSYQGVETDTWLISHDPGQDIILEFREDEGEVVPIRMEVIIFSRPDGESSVSWVMAIESYD